MRTPADTAIQRWFRSHWRELHRAITRKLGCGEDAADIVQETYVRMLALDAPEEIENPRAFLYRTASNLTIDHLRARRSRSTFATIGSLEDLADEAPLPEQQLAAQEHLARCEQVLAKLSPLQREILIMSRFEGHTHVSIAKKLGISVSWVEKNIIQALRHCREHLPRE